MLKYVFICVTPTVIFIFKQKFCVLSAVKSYNTSNLVEVSNEAENLRIEKVLYCLKDLRVSI